MNNQMNQFFGEETQPPILALHVQLIPVVQGLPKPNTSEEEENREVICEQCAMHMEALAEKMSDQELLCHLEILINEAQERELFRK